MPVSRTRKTKKSGRPARPPARGRAGGGVPRPLAVGLVIILVCALGLGVLATLSGIGGDGDTAGGTDAAGQATPTEEATVPPVNSERRIADDPLAVGDAEAPVVLVEYMDFQSPACGTHVRDMYPLLLEQYVDTGALRIEFRNFPIFGPESDAAARAAWAAGQQGRFWEFYEVAYGEQFEMDSGRFADEELPGLAEQAGVPDLDRFAEDLESEAAGEAVGTDSDEALMIGIPGTPAFFVNGTFVADPQDADAFTALIDQEYEAATA
ncbi:thioredoxin domain-containing protein [Streptomyces sp. RFCAC02]|uniref:DsbA family protein n=1 Tax=Streptomyces sp. RFCAC02 TaxID=2499143 RepID=UPI001020285E|nr:thioredoxin domain-containing protein [Streptomyces sp. RFCAC02]